MDACSIGVIEMNLSNALEAAFMLANGWEREREWQYYTQRLNAIAIALLPHIKLTEDDVRLIKNVDAQKLALETLLEMKK